LNSIFSSKMVEIVWNFYDISTSFIQIMRANFNKFEKFSKELWPKGENNDIMTKTKTYRSKNVNWLKLCEPIFQIFLNTKRKICCLDCIKVLKINLKTLKVLFVALSFMKQQPQELLTNSKIFKFSNSLESFQNRMRFQK